MRFINPAFVLLALAFLVSCAHQHPRPYPLPVATASPIALERVGVTRLVTRALGRERYAFMIDIGNIQKTAWVSTSSARG